VPGADVAEVVVGWQALDEGEAVLAPRNARVDVPGAGVWFSGSTGKRLARVKLGLCRSKDRGSSSTRVNK
jgi:hypothetical protein